MPSLSSSLLPPLSYFLTLTITLSYCHVRSSYLTKMIILSSCLFLHPLHQLSPPDNLRIRTLTWVLSKNILGCLGWYAGVSSFGRLVVCKQAGWRVEWVGTRDKTLRQIYCPHTAHATQDTGHSTCHRAHGTQHTGRSTLDTALGYVHLSQKSVYIWM